jgi:SEC-C motif-containing protein
MQTTHPHNSAYKSDKNLWESEILAFSKKTQFRGLKILEFIDGPHEAYVTFTAYLSQGDQDTSFTEKSHFLKVDGRWLYASGKMLNL